MVLFVFPSVNVQGVKLREVPTYTNMFLGQFCDVTKGVIIHRKI
jgi:hypothetical protein